MVYLDERLYHDGTNINSPPILKELCTDLVLTSSRGIYEQCIAENIPVQYLYRYLGFREPVGLYEIFSYYFEGHIETDEDMLRIVFRGLIKPSGYCFCLKIGKSFSWFTVTASGVETKGYMQFSRESSKYNVGRFIKCLRYELVKSGYNLNYIKWLVWDETDLSDSFKDYLIKYDMLSEFFSKVDGLKGLSLRGVMRVLSPSLTRLESRANIFVDCLKSSCHSLGLYEHDGILYSGTTYYKDYSSCVSPIIDKRFISGGIILDCEGKRGSDGALSNGFRECGGIIYCRYDNMLLSLDTFVCDEQMLASTMTRVLQNYKELIGDYKTIEVSTYGSSDKVMFWSSLGVYGGKSLNTKLHRILKFNDVSGLIRDTVGVDNLSLESLADKLRVVCLKPTHNPLNDCRTLFNILAVIISKGGKSNVTDLNS